LPAQRLRPVRQPCLRLPPVGPRVLPVFHLRYHPKERLNRNPA